MKVILTAFGDRLRSEVMEWPEESGDRSTLSIHWVKRDIRINVVEAKLATSRFKPPDLDPLVLTLLFEQTGRTFQQEDGSLAVEYELIEWR